MLHCSKERKVYNELKLGKPQYDLFWNILYQSNKARSRHNRPFIMILLILACGQVTVHT